MAILRSQDGKFYEVPDEQASEFEMSEEQVKEMGGDQAEDQQQLAPAGGADMQMPGGDASGGITVNLNFGGGGGGGGMMPQPGPQAQGEQQGENKEGEEDVQGHGWRYIYRNRYYAYRNRYWAYRNRY